MNYAARRAHTQAWRERRFGLFIHFGLFSVLGKNEHVLASEHMPADDYRALRDRFNPDVDCMTRLVEQARAAGMRYAVLTTKHADGFCLFASDHSDFTSVHSAARRDLVAEFVTACRAAGLGVGLYYNQHSRLHPDCPIPPNHPARVDATRYTDFVHAQVRELLTRYGVIDYLWFDDAIPDWHGPKLRSDELVALVRSLQPGIVVNNRLRPLGVGVLHVPPPGDAGDVGTPEGNIPPRPITDERGRPVAWETCLTLNNHWSHVPEDRAYKTPTQVIGALVECVSKDGNLLLNVGPDARGRIDAEAPILAEVGTWVHRNADAVFGCGPAEWTPPPRCLYTQRGSTLYAHVLQRGVGPLPFPGLAPHVREARLLTTREIVPPGREGLRRVWPDTLWLNLPGPALPEEPVTVVELSLHS